MNEFNENLINQKMDKAIISYQNDLNGIRAGRASINMLDSIGNEFFLSTIPWRWDRVLKKLDRTILNFIVKHMIKKIKNL